MRVIWLTDGAQGVEESRRTKLSDRDDQLGIPRGPVAMPAGLAAQDTTERRAVQVGQLVRARDTARIDRATAHMHARRPLGGVMAMGRWALTTSLQTWRAYAATPPFAELALVVAWVSAQQQMQLEFSAASSFDATPRTFTLQNFGHGNLITHQVELLVAIGDGTPLAPTDREVTLAARKVVAGAPTAFMHGWGVWALPTISDTVDAS